MNTNSWTTTDLCNLVKLLGHFPQANTTFTAPQILTLADFEAQTSITKQLKQADEGYFQTYVDYDQNDTGIYDVPTDAVISGAYVIQIRNGQAIWPVSRQDVGEMTTTTFPSGGNYSFFIQGNKINVLPIQFSGSLRVVYESRLSKLVAVTSCAQISGISGQVLTVTSVPTGWANGTTIDLQQALPQFNYLGTFNITDITGVNITLDGDISGVELSLGDYVCLEGQTCVPQMPSEFQQLLAQRVVCKIYEIQGYMDKLGAAKKVLQEMEDALTAMIAPRTQAAPKVVAPSWGGRQPGNSWGRFNPPAGRSNN